MYLYFCVVHEQSCFFHTFCCLLNHNGFLNVLPNSLENQKIERCLCAWRATSDRPVLSISYFSVSNSNSPFRQRKPFKVQSHSLFFKSRLKLWLIKLTLLNLSRDPFQMLSLWVQITCFLLFEFAENKMDKTQEIALTQMRKSVQKLGSSIEVVMLCLSHIG